MALGATKYMLGEVVEVRSGCVRALMLTAVSVRLFKFLPLGLFFEVMLQHSTTVVNILQIIFN